jgi:hypothetical protein
MNDEEIKQGLEISNFPVMDDSAKKRIIKVSVARFCEVERESFERKQNSLSVTVGRWLEPLWRPALAITVCSLVYMMVNAQNPIQLAGEVKDLEYEITLLKEYQSLFPEELKALVNHQGQVDLVLGGNNFLQANPTVVIDFINQGERIRLVGISGQSISFQLGGQEIQVEVLINKENQILLVGKDFVWEEHQAKYIRGYQVVTQVVGVQS